MSGPASTIEVRGATEHNLQNVDLTIDRGALTVITGVSGSGKSSLAFDTILAEAQRRFFYTLSHYSRQFLDLAARPAVRTLTGLSPAIALAQNETPPSRRATVGTLSDLSELVSVLYARFAEQRCPTHDLPTSAMTAQEIATGLMDRAAGQTVAVCAAVAEAKKGTFKTQLAGYATRGYLKAMIDGKLVSLAAPPALAREDRHTIKLVVDYVKLKPGAEARLVRGVEAALAEGGGFGAWHPADAQGAVELAAGAAFSAKGGCPRCAFSWPRLDSRHLSANSLGRCEVCGGLGVDASGYGEESGEGDAEDDLGARERTGLDDPCAACAGTGLAATLRGLRLLGKTPHDLHTMPVGELADFLTRLAGSGTNAALVRVADEARAGAARIAAVGLGYLTMARRIRSLSGGEAQRLKLAGIVAENLRGVLYVLDEPSQGLHPSEIDLLVQSLTRLKAAGNTILVVDHDEALMRQADWIVDLGPGGGARGGRVLAKFRPAEAPAFAAQSATARYLSQSVAERSGDTRLNPIRSGSGSVGCPQISIVIEGATRNYLQIPTVRFPIGALTVVAGVSGAGKSSLVLQTLYPNVAAHLAKGGVKKWLHAKRISGLDAMESVALVDRRPVAKSSVSMPATYLDVFGELRELYAAQPDAQVMGLTARSFSLAADAGRCPECKGRGEQSLSMRFLADARVRCPVCKGRRYQGNVLAVRYLGRSLADVLDLTLDEVVACFKTHRKIVQRLSPAVELGLGYLKLGQPTASLSGGEAQRLKLVPHLTRARSKPGQGHLILLDEPTTGLHFEDVARLLKILRELAGAGTTVVAIEHNADVIQAADWVIELGPGAAREGGRLTREGPPGPVG